MWELDCKEGWALKNWCFWTVVLEKIVESPFHCKIKPVTLKDISPEYSLKGLMLKLTLQYFGHLMWRPDSLEKTLMLGKTEGRCKRGWHDKGQDGWMASPIQWTWIWENSVRLWRTGKHGILQSMRLQRVWHNWATEQQSVWKLKKKDSFFLNIL